VRCTAYSSNPNCFAFSFSVTYSLNFKKKKTMKSLILIVNLLFFTLLAYSQSKSTKTIKDLKEGIKGETTASAKYAAFAQKARTEGQYTIAKLFDAASKAESIHAANHTRTLNEMGEKMENVTPQFEVKTTAENLQSALEGETPVRRCQRRCPGAGDQPDAHHPAAG
jgi:hypothetical protein